MKKKNESLREVYELAIAYSKDAFEERFNKLKSDRTSEFISLRNTRRSLRTEIREECNANIYDYCFRNIGRFIDFSKQFSSQQEYAKSIAINAVTNCFNKYSKFMNAIENLENKSRRNFLREDDPSYKMNMAIAESVIKDHISKYKAVRKYLQNTKIKSGETTISNAFDSFLKNHKKEVIKKFTLSELQFLKYFFPKKLPKS